MAAGFGEWKLLKAFQKRISGYPDKTDHLTIW
jgi:hypothetical protein